MEKMNPEIKEKWVKALRSGKYKQGKGALRRADNSFCCLGVLCDLVKPEDWFFNDEHDIYNHGVAGGYPTHQVAKKAQLVYNETLANMNDSGKSFNDIASWIEESL